MSAGLDARHVRHAFARAAETYEAHAVLQAEVAARLLERLDGTLLQPLRVLDAGSGPGLGASTLAQRFPDAEIVALDIAPPMLRAAASRARGAHPFARVAADVQALPLLDGAFDLVYSNLCLQWCDDPGLAIAELARVLRPGGLLLFTTFGPATLFELRDAFANADATPHVSRFVDMHDIGDALLTTGFRDPVLEREDFTLTYTDALSLMRELRAIGATNADEKRRRTLTGKSHLRRVVDAYEAFRIDGVLPATYEVVYAQAFAPMPGQPRRTPGGEVASFPVERLRGSRR
ncbi:MAG: malonyl-ACP O-methyltransferase BioC [Rhodanobacteraceae bacterium]